MLYEKHNYLNKNLKYIRNASIVEYDMKNGGISILYHKQLISKEDYDYLMNDLNKHERNITVGKWLKENPEVSKELLIGFTEARRIFFEKNEIQDSQVLSIKKDAIFLIDKSINYEQLNKDYLFRKKNKYTTYLNLNNKEFYYNIDTNKLDIKGLSEESIKIQKDYLIKDIIDCLILDSDSKTDQLFVKLLELKNNFINKKLPVEYYYDIKFNGYLFKYDKYKLLLDKINNDDLNNEYFIINNNLNIILELISNLLS